MISSGNNSTDIYINNIKSCIEDDIVSNFQISGSSSSGSNIKWEVRDRCTNTYASEIVGEDASSNSQGNRTEQTISGKVSDERSITYKLSSSYYASGTNIAGQVRITLYSELKFICRCSNTNPSRCINGEFCGSITNLEYVISRCSCCNTNGIKDSNT